jgi:hypothetical protein
MQPSQDGGGDGRPVSDRYRRRRAVQQGEHVSKVVEDAPAFGALRRVVLESRPSLRPQVGVEVGRHVWRRPPVVTPEAQLVPESAHRSFDPVIDGKVRRPPVMNRLDADRVKVDTWT